MTKVKQIIAMGGGGFTMEPDNPLLDDFVLRQSQQSRPKICLLPTASGDHEEYIQGFYDLFLNRRCTPSHLSLYDSPSPQPEAAGHLLGQDIIYVSGGHTAKMLRKWKELGIDDILREAWQRGIVLAGVSAGAACWFEEALTDSDPERLSRDECLKFLKGSFCAHFDNSERRPAFYQHIGDGIMKDGLGVDNFACLHFIGTEIKQAVASRPGAWAYHISRKGTGQIVEKPIHTTYLGM
jgi:dipeptidase E